MQHTSLSPPLLTTRCKENKKESLEKGDHLLRCARVILNDDGSGNNHHGNCVVRDVDITHEGGGRHNNGVEMRAMPMVLLVTLLVDSIHRVLLPAPILMTLVDR